MLHIHSWWPHIHYSCEVTAHAAKGAPWFPGRAGHDTQRSFTDSHTAYLSIFLRVTRLGEKTTLAAATRVSLEKKKRKRKEPNKAA